MRYTFLRIHRLATPFMLELLLSLLVLVPAVGALPMPMLMVYLVGTGAVFSAFAFDKAQAAGRTMRTPEMALYFMGVVFPAGALLGRRAFNHKTRKISFLLVPAVGAALQLLFFVGWS